MKNRSDSPKIFISYSWTSTNHKNWVKDLAEKLSSDGVDVIFDQWDLKEGQDKNKFMEKMVNDPSIAKVLMICDKEYADKADNRLDGVGTEAQIISPEIYNNLEQTKFIPIIKEKNKDGKPYLPTYLNTRIFIDLSISKKYNDEYEKLLRNIFDKPIVKKPVIGIPPSYITETDKILIKTSHKFEDFKNAVIKNHSNAKGFLIDYLNSFINAFEDFKIDFSDSKIPDDQKIYDSIHNFKPYKNEFINFLYLINTYTNNDDYYEEIFSFLEQLIHFNFNQKEGSFKEYYLDNYKFISYELFLNLIASLIKSKKYRKINFFLDEQYYVNINNLIYSDYQIFYNGIPSLDIHRKNRLNLNRISITADLIKERATKNIQFKQIMEAELLITIKSILHPNNTGFFWYPRTLILAGMFPRFELFSRAISKRHFNNLKIALNIKSKDDLIEKWNKRTEIFNFDRMNFGWRFPDFDKLLNIDELDTI